MITINIYNTEAQILNLKDSKIFKELDHNLSYQIPGYQFANFNKNWDGKNHLLKKSGKFPVGMLYTVKLVLDSNNIDYIINDMRPEIKRNPIKMRAESYFKPRDYQIDAKNKSIEAGSGVLQVCTGGGKTLIISMILAEYNCNTVVYVIGTDLLYQMKNTIEEAYGIECGIVGDGHCDIKKITVATIWSAAAAFNQKIKIIDNDMNIDSELNNKNLNKLAVQKMVKDAQLIFIDECQYASAETVQMLHKLSESARHRFLLSGTPWRDTGDDILIEAVGGPKIVKITATELISRGFLIQPEIHFVNIPTMKNSGKTYHEIYQNYIVDNDYRNNKILEIAEKLVKSKKKVLILVVRKEHGKILLDLLNTKLRAESLDGSNSTSQRQNAVNGIKDGSVDVLIASKIFDQGVDIPELDALILAGSGKSSGRALQRIGRVIRKADNKKLAVVVDFADNCKYLKEHSKLRLKVYKTEPGFKIKLPSK
jgi:superfamily II DNA or RNA helicase